MGHIDLNLKSLTTFFTSSHGFMGNTIKLSSHGGIFPRVEKKIYDINSDDINKKILLMPLYPNHHSYVMQKLFLLNPWNVVTLHSTLLWALGAHTTVVGTS